MKAGHLQFSASEYYLFPFLFYIYIINPIKESLWKLKNIQKEKTN